jgi:hypothetical protein
MTTTNEALRQVDDDWRAYTHAVIALCQLADTLDAADENDRVGIGNQLSIQLAAVTRKRRLWLESQADLCLATEQALF